LPSQQQVAAVVHAAAHDLAAPVDLQQCWRLCRAAQWHGCCRVRLAVLLLLLPLPVLQTVVQLHC
jgi:hypothetical protein